MRFRLRLMGPVNLTDAEGRDVTPRGRKARGMLALLGTAPGLRMVRAQLQDRLWSRSPPVQSSASLRQTLTDLRHVLAAALVGGEVMMGFSSAGAVKPLLDSGRLKALGVSSLKRLGNAPAGLRTIAEQGFPAYDVTFTLGILAPAGTPPEIVNRLNTEISAILKAEDIRNRIAEQGMEAGTSTPEEYKALMRSNIEQWAKVIKDANIKIE